MPKVEVGPVDLFIEGGAIEQPGFFQIVLDQPDAQPDELAQRVRSGDLPADEVIAANLSDPIESNVSPVEDLPVGEESDTANETGIRLLGYREPWIYLVLAAILLLVLEWATFNRRMTV